MEDVFGYQVDEHVQSSTALRQHADQPSRYVDNKVIDHVDSLSQRFIAACSLALISSVRPDGVVDVTPRGDPAGFIHVVNKNLIAIPDRPGNNRMDTFENIMDNQNIGVIFIIPGHRDTLRLSGQAALVKDERLGIATAINGRAAALVLLVKVERVLCHCPKAFIRGKVWQPDEWPDTSDVPSLGEMMVAHGNMADTVAEVDEVVENDGKVRLY